MKKLLIALIIGISTANAGNVFPVKNNLGNLATSLGKVIEVEINESGDLTFHYENGYCVNFVNTEKLVCNRE